MPFKLAFFVSFCCLFWTLTNAVIYEGGIAIDDGPETDPDGSMKKYIVVFKEGVSDDAGTFSFYCSFLDELLMC